MAKWYFFWFKKVGAPKYAFLPIGAYDPEWFMSESHVNPEDSVKIMNDLEAEYSFGMHWGTFVLSLEPIMEPPKRFKAGAEKYGFKNEDVIVYKIGEFGSLKKLLNYN